jgi:hypothetical protein
MKKIAVGINIFKTSKRQDLCIQSLLKCKKLFPDIIDLYNIQYENSNDITEHTEFKTLKALKQTSNKICGGNRNLPCVKEMFDCLANLNYEYFCFINSDIIISSNFFKEILNNPEYDAYIASRLAIVGDNIKDLNFSIKLNDPTSSVVNSHFQVSGFDCFTIKSTWWHQNRHKFPEHIYAIIYWDTHYATILLKSGNVYMQNKKPTIFHIIHEDNSSARCPELTHNENIFHKQHHNDFVMWHRYFFEVLVKRGPQTNFLYPHKNELELQEIYFKSNKHEN